MSLDGFVELIFNVYEAHTVALFMRDGEHLSCLSALTFAKSFDKAKLLPLDGTLAGWAVKHNEPLIIGNFDKDEETLGYYGKREEIKSFMAYPLEIPGSIVVDSKKKWVFTDKEKKILAHFVRVVSREVERERRLREMEEEREELSLLRRQINFLRQPRPDGSLIEDALKDALSVSAGDLALLGVERKGRLSIVAAVGAGAASFLGAECPTRMTIASTVLEGGREFLLPSESGFLRERPLLFPNDGIRARQYFGFPLMVDEKPFGFLGFVSLASRPLREDSITGLRDTAVLMSLFLGRLRMREEMEWQTNRDPATGALRFSLFFDGLADMARQKKGFSVVSIRLPGFRAYNKAFGPGYGDDLLRRMYQGIEYCIGRNTMITRSGGAHFYVAITGSDGLEEGRNILNILKFTIVNTISRQAPGAKKGLEVGTAYFPKDGRDLWELLGIAEGRARKNGA
ncbi:MAG: GAF domain-containing protein [Syntrophorhabdales bacterium]|jgi:GGDEF domain-containing protein